MAIMRPFWEKEVFMNCKFCNAELEDGITVCPSCGAVNEVEETVEQEPIANDEVVVSEETEELPSAMEETEEMTEDASEDETEEESEEAEEQPKKKAKKTVTMSWQALIAVIGAIVVLVALAVVLLFGMGVVELADRDTDTSSSAYMVSDKKAKRAAGKVVATMDGAELTNGMLQIYYNGQVSGFINSYYSYLEQVGLDLSKPLSEQTCYYDENRTWEEYFIDASIETWYNYQALYLMAQDQGFELDAENQKVIEQAPEDLKKTAKEAEFESVEAMLKERIGANCNEEDYLEYLKVYCTVAEFTNITPTDEEVETYFNENSEAFSEQGLTKESGPMVDVRHILIAPEGGKENEDMTVTYSEEEWDACLEKAEAVYKEWKDGAATEESFAALVPTYTADGGSSTTGGLYSGITKDSSYVEPFLTWCMDEDRKVGDTGLVKTEFGYHIMYFSATVEQWRYYAEGYLVSELTEQMLAEAKEKRPIEINLDKVRLAQIDLG